MKTRSCNIFMSMFFLSFWIYANSVAAQVIPVCVDPHDQYLDGMSNNRIFYGDGRKGELFGENWMYDITTGTETLIGDTYNDFMGRMDIRDGKIAHSSSRDGQNDLYIVDVLSLTEIQITNNPLWRDHKPQVSKHGIFFNRYDGDNIDPNVSGLYLYEGGSVTLFSDDQYALCLEMGGDWAVFSGSAGTQIYNMLSKQFKPYTINGMRVTLDGNKMAFIDYPSRTFKVLDLITDEEEIIKDLLDPNGFWPSEFKLSGNKIVYLGGTGTDPYPYGIYLYNLETSTEELVLSEEDASYPRYLAFDGNHIVWQTWFNPDSDIFMYVLEEKEPIGIVSSVQGDVTINSSNNPVAQGAIVMKGDKIETGNNGIVKIWFDYLKTSVSLAPNSIISPKRPSANKLSIEQFYGNVRAKVKKMMSTQEFEIITPQCVTSDRGTELIVDVKDTYETHMVLKGEAEISVLGTEPVVVSENYAVNIQNGDIGTPYPIDPQLTDRWWADEVIVSLASPVDLCVKDEFGNKTGHCDNELINEIPGAIYSGPETIPEYVIISNPSSGFYGLDLMPTGTGDYHLTMFVDTEDSDFIEEYEGSVTEGGNAIPYTIIDEIPPEVSCSVAPSVIWPPNHKMVNVTPLITAIDNCDPNPQFKLLSITMNESEESNTFDPTFDDTQGDGNTNDDIQVDVSGNIFLRAERSGEGDGRVYTLTYEAEDSSGNTATATATVTVPHDMD